MCLAKQGLLKVFLVEDLDVHILLEHVFFYMHILENPLGVLPAKGAARGFPRFAIYSDPDERRHFSKLIAEIAIQVSCDHVKFYISTRKEHHSLL